jgi:predicted PurR-regulated permease PerM
MSRPSESHNAENKEQLIAQRFFFLLLISAVLLLACVVKPIAGALFLAAVLAGVLWPLHQRFSSLLRGRQALSAAVLTLGVVILVIGPVVAFAAFAIIEGEKGLTFLIDTVRSDGMMGLLERLPSPMRHLVQQTAERLSVRGTDDLARTIRGQMSTHGGNAALALGATLSATGALLFQAAMTLIALYFLLLQGKELVSWLDGLSPLKQGQTRELLTEFKRVSFAVILSTVITSAVQAAAALGGYWIAAVPHSLFFAGVTFFVAFVPAVGATSVCLVAALLVLATGHPYAALFLALWGLAVVGLVDNLIKPLLIHAGMHMNGAVVFFSLIGGLSAFGGVGLLLGPLVVALLLSLMRMYRRDYKPLPAATP